MKVLCTHSIPSLTQLLLQKNCSGRSVMQQQLSIIHILSFINKPKTPTAYTPTHAKSTARESAHLLNALSPVAWRLRGSHLRDAVPSAHFSNTAACIPLLRGMNYAVAAIHVAFLSVRGGGGGGGVDAGKMTSWHVSVWPSLVCSLWSSSLYLWARCFTVLEARKQQRTETLGAAF